MLPSQLVVDRKFVILLIVATFCIENGVNANYRYDLDGLQKSFVEPVIHTLDWVERVRFKRDVVGTSSTEATTSAGGNATSSPTAAAPVAGASDVNKTPKTKLSISTVPPASVTEIPLLGRNGTGILKVNITQPKTKVSDPILPDDGDDNDKIIQDVFSTPEKIKAEHNLTNIKEDNHSFYNSTFIGNKTYFNEYWANITNMKSEVHPILSNSHRRATTLTLKFEFPFYGHGIKNITVATGGFIYTGDHVHNWLAATQYIAPLMANFDTTLSNDSVVKMCNLDDRFTVFWENVTVQEERDKKFTFAATLYKNGNIDFAYKDVPIPVQNISDTEHPVKVGISDAYLNDRIFFLIRRKTIYEYHRVSFKDNYDIESGTILRLVALPTCLQYRTCGACVSHDTGFDCMWCDAIQKCSSGTDRNKQDWMVRSCNEEGHYASNISQCHAHTVDGGQTETGNTAYVTDEDANKTNAVVSTMRTVSRPALEQTTALAPVQAPVRAEPAPESGGSAVGGAVAALAIIALVAALFGWVVYAFKNPHTRSGQILIKYRPSQWRWRRGEARYTAATIHM